MQMTTSRDGPMKKTSAIARSRPGNASCAVRTKLHRMIDPASEVTSQNPQRNADDQSDRGRTETDRDRNPRSVNEATEIVAPDMVGAEKVLPAAALHPDRWQEAIGQRLLIGAVRRQKRGENPPPEPAPGRNSRSDLEAAMVPGPCAVPAGRGWRGSSVSDVHSDTGSTTGLDCVFSLIRSVSSGQGLH